MADRRGFLVGLLAGVFSPRLTWADAGNPAYLTAAQRPDGAYTLCGLDALGGIAFEIPLPGRGHAAAAHPHMPRAVAFARRPGRYALVIDCASGREVAHLEAPSGRHFYGHGTYSSDGSVLYTTENDYDAARGTVGLWDAAGGYRRIGEMSSGGVGPHDILCLPGKGALVVANGGIETHPDTARAKLNLPWMQPNLSFISMDGDLLNQLELGPELRQNSIRHLDVLPTGHVAFAMQWEGPSQETPPLLGLCSLSAEVRLLSAPQALHKAMSGYAGSVAFSKDGETVAITSPRGGVVQAFRTHDGTYLAALAEADVCGLSRGHLHGFFLTSGAGRTGAWTGGSVWRPSRHNRVFDNHVIKI